MRNLVRTISDKYFPSPAASTCWCSKACGPKCAAYLLSEAERAGSLTFSIPFSRIQLADYLNCDRQRPQPQAEPDAAGRPAGHLQKQLQAAGAYGTEANGAVTI
ncbi:MAG: helix-turn-helix domain-containing protein [Faecalibacterium prausnitzii]